ncbi:monosaccharide ABC transporter substrate-binding protein, CUT2 family [Vibrio sp. ES.051]|uniref:TMAO reductase system periplasmic protein TorT n=1 Tax=Vibrio sp. ES.051 TaxID=1761909 RepID=UPI000BF4DDA8|nr:TMAO reductase system periplasmic protein TorT [Vibrio sp. ES.051]PFG57982.1 monosaccharide ABC transporter substrate-binding protein, CUT2 family [Vibrio sp. ES.051]
MVKNQLAFRTAPRYFTLALSLFVSLPTAAAEKICAIYPHLKDSYWLSVNYGMVSEAKKQGVELRVLEAGGYPNQTRQEQQLTLCSQWGADAIVLGTVAPHAYKHSLKSWVGNIPVFATVNQLDLDTEQSKLLKGTVGVDWHWMGYEAGKYLATHHPKGSGKTNIALLLGPRTSGGTKPVTAGFYEAIQGSDINIVESFWADNDKELQRNLAQRVIDMGNIDYIVGSAVAIEVAISELRSAGKTEDIGLVSVYLSHGVYRGLLRNKVLFAPTDKMVQQGRLSILQAAHYLRGEAYERHASPVIEPLTPKTLHDDTIEESLSPSEYRPTFHVKPVD